MRKTTVQTLTFSSEESSQMSETVRVRKVPDRKDFSAVDWSREIYSFTTARDLFHKHINRQSQQQPHRPVN